MNTQQKKEKIKTLQKLIKEGKDCINDYEALKKLESKSCLEARIVEIIDSTIKIVNAETEKFKKELELLEKEVENTN